MSMFLTRKKRHEQNFLSLTAEGVAEGNIYFYNGYSQDATLMIISAQGNFMSFVWRQL